MGFDQRAMKDMLKQAQQMQAQMERAQAKLAEETVVGGSAITEASSVGVIPPSRRMAL